MTNPVNHSQSKYNPSRYENEKAYNDVPCGLNQVLAPFVIRDKEMRQSKDINPNNLKTFRFYGKAVLVGFVPVFIEDFDNVIKIFNMDVNEEVECRNKKYGQILRLIYENMDIAKQDIISTLGMKKTQGYAAIKKAQAMAKEVYRELNQ